MSTEIQLLNNEFAWEKILGHPLFREVAEEELRKALPFFEPITLRSGDLLIEEGHSMVMNLYVIVSGNVEVFKKTDKNDGTTYDHGLEQFIIAKLTAGDLVGEGSFTRGIPRSASVRCLSETKLLALSPDQAKKLELEFPAVFGTIMKNLAGHISHQLALTTTNEVRSLKTELQNSILNSKANLFFSYVIGLLCIYNLTISRISQLSIDADKASIISAIIIVTFCLGLILMVWQSKLPLRIIGLTTELWQSSLKESLLWTAVIVSGMVGVKWALVTFVPNYQHLPVFDFDLSQRYMGLNFILYGLHSPIQEFVARGVLQGSLQHFFSGKNVALRAIIVSNALFSATHVHLMEGLLGVIVFIPGLFWGWLYSRNQNLIGVSVSHLIIGWFGLFFLNLERLF